MNNPFQKPYPNQLRRFRRKAGFSQKELAKLIGHKTTAHISRYEHGVKLPNLITALKICAALGTLVDVAFGDLNLLISKEITERKQRYNLWENLN